ncbi:peptide ABC transporter substrate-binding protein [Thiorhodovibrio winogradskyi]|nr:peptide ABC transporter substrate-binding protein [Thiorhodovibrio winogradskyi]
MSVGICALALLLTACGGPVDSEGMLRFGIANSARNLDPRHATDATSERVNHLLYRALVDFDDSGRPVPGLASWEQLSDRRYRFVLGQDGRDFSDGSRLNARDVAATYRSLVDPATGSPHGAQLALIDDIQVLDNDRLEFLLSRADPLFPSYLGLGILPADALAAGRDFAREPLGSGPFVLHDWPESGRLILERRRDGQRVELVTVKDPSVRVMKLLRGEVDLLQNDLPPELVAYLRRQPSVVVETRLGVNFSYLGFNLEDPLLSQRKLRMAIAYAIDREAILKYLFHDLGRTAQALLPPEHWAGAPDLKAYRHDPERARELLAGFGYGPEHPLQLTYKTSSDPFRLRVASVLQAQLEEVGIVLRIRSYDWGTFFGDIKSGRFQLYSLTWVGVRGPDIFRYVFHSDSVPPHGANRGRFRDARVDDLIDRAGVTEDVGEQVALYRELQALLLHELPYVPLWYEDQVLARRAEVSGYRLAADGDYDGLEMVTIGRSVGPGTTNGRSVTDAAASRQSPP